MRPLSRTYCLCQRHRRRHRRRFQTGLCSDLYALTPYFFEGRGTIPVAREPSLDSASANILAALLKRLQ